MLSKPDCPQNVTPLLPILGVTFCASLGTGMMWNGIPFITEKDYEFDKTQNLLLYICIGVVYIISALVAGHVQRRLDRWMSPRVILAGVLCIQAVVCLLPALTHGAWVVWTLTIVFSATSALLWPIIESYLSAGRYGAAMRGAIGWWNVVWMSAVAVPLWLMAPLMDSAPRLAIVALGFVLLLATLPLLWFRTHPGDHDAEVTQAHTSNEYPMLLHSARVMLLLSYVLLAAMSPLLPFMFNTLNIDSTWQTPSTATWMIARVLVVAVMWRVTFWHGRWGTLVLSGVAMIIAFVVIIVAPTLIVLLAGLALLGGALGIVYYAALYYAMSVGSAAVDAGGRHEAIIGAGYAIGPAAGLSALFFSTAGTVGVLDVSFKFLFATIIIILAIVGAVAAFLPYRRARTLRL